MNSVVFPNRSVLKNWVAVLQSPVFALSAYLPAVDEKWYDDIIGVCQLLQLPYYPNDIHILASKLFYKIIKNHYIGDGNKRSALVVVYLFYFINDYKVAIPPDILYELARIVADAKEGEAETCADIQKIFSEHITCDK